jgi:hypothetical protein
MCSDVFGDGNSYAHVVLNDDRYLGVHFECARAFILKYTPPNRFSSWMLYDHELMDPRPDHCRGMRFGARLFLTMEDAPEPEPTSVIVLSHDVENIRLFLNYLERTPLSRDESDAPEILLAYI